MKKKKKKASSNSFKIQKGRMVGVILITYGNLGRELLDTAKHIVENTKKIGIVSIDRHEDKKWQERRSRRVIKYLMRSKMYCF